MGDLLQRILTVSQLTFLVRTRLEVSFPEIWVEGEISNLRAPASGHLYFTLKDAAAQIRAVLFRNSAQRLRFALEEGLQVVVRGRLSVYEPRGDYQILVDDVEPKGIGALQIALEQLKEKLAREGLFDEARKRPLPMLPRRVGVVTSPTGAAIRDVLTVLHRRCPAVPVLVVPVSVQGEGAAEEIAHGVRTLSESGLVDVMIVGRGGGSLEDLWCFNEEVVVRAIAASRVPVVSGVGHDIDITLADFAADVRAPTPSAAAMAVAPARTDLVRHLAELHRRVVRGLGAKLEAARHVAGEVRQLAPALRLRLHRSGQQVDDETGQLCGVLARRLDACRRHLASMQHRTSGVSPLARLRAALALLPQLVKRTEQATVSAIETRRGEVRTLIQGLDSLSPLQVLARGYSLLQRVPDGRVVTRADTVAVGEDIRARLAHGELLCRILQILKA